MHRRSIAALWLTLLVASACATSSTIDPTGGAVAGPGVGGSGAGGGGAGGDGGSGSGGCTSAEECVAFTDACNVGTCINGECEKVPANEDLSCDDGLTCTLVESCKAGVCTATQEMPCPASDSCHIGMCDLLTDACAEAPGNDGSGCIDDDPCTVTGFCSGGVCAPAEEVDCSSLDTECGLGFCDPAGNCQGGAPTNEGGACDDGNGCTGGTTCQSGACTNPMTEIVACIDDDDCCPVNCPLDDDCSITVGIVHAEDDLWALDVQDTLVSTGEFTTVDLVDARSSTPTLAELAPYDAVLVFSDPFFTGWVFDDPFALGDVLADYFDAGGRVVLSAFGNCEGSPIQGRFVTNGYLVLGIASADDRGIPDSLGNISEPGSPLLAGVTSFSASTPARCWGTPVNGGTSVASWGAGKELIVRGTIQGKNRVDLNFLPVSSAMYSEFWEGDGATILANALLYK
jgi:hypothetical protein